MKFQLFIYPFLLITLLLVTACSDSSTNNETNDRDLIPGTVLTLAGSGDSGFSDGTDMNAQFNQPSGLFIDSQGNILISDKFNDAIRVLSPTGVVSTLIRGDATQPGFRRPNAVINDQNGDILFSEESNHQIWKVTGSGEYSILAGRGSRGTNNGPALEAGFYIPFGLAYDASGNLIVADAGNFSVRKLSSSSDVSTLAGSGAPGFANGNGTSAEFEFPTGLVADNQGNVYVADSGNNMIRRITPDGTVSVYAGTGERGSADGPAASATFYSPYGLAIDSAGNIYVADTENNLIRKITAQGIVKTVAGNGNTGNENGTSAQAEFYYPSDVAIDRDGNLIVADLLNHSIRKIIFD